MGYMRHHAVIVTSYSKEMLTDAHQEALRLFPDQVSPLVDSPINRYASFFVAPDGSKEGWPESERGNVKRDEFVGYLEGKKYEDNSSSIDYVEVFYGDDEGEAEVVRHN